MAFLIQSPIVTWILIVLLVNHRWHPYSLNDILSYLPVSEAQWLFRYPSVGPAVSLHKITQDCHITSSLLSIRFISLFASLYKPTWMLARVSMNNPYWWVSTLVSTNICAHTDLWQPLSMRKRKRSTEHESSRVNPTLPLTQSIFYSETDMSFPWRRGRSASQPSMTSASCWLPTTACSKCNGSWTSSSPCANTKLSNTNLVVSRESLVVAAAAAAAVHTSSHAYGLHCVKSSR